MSDPARAQRTVFGEVAAQYDRARPSYPEALFDTVMEFGALASGDRALEIGGGTGKATLPFLARGLDVLALEPSPGMATVLRSKRVAVVESPFEDYAPTAAFSLLFAAQSWHWVPAVARREKAAVALQPGGTIALFWNLGREWDGELGAANDAVYARLAPHLVKGTIWNMDPVLDELVGSGAFEEVEKRVFTWSCTYTRREWETLLGSHSDHLMLADDVRAELHAAIGDVIDAHGGSAEVIYDTVLFIARRG